MKLGTLRDGSRDGRLIVASRDLDRCLPATGIAPTLQAALDDWDARAPALRALADRLEQDPSAGEPLPRAQLAAPLPRAYGWMDGSAYLNHMELARGLRKAKMPDGFRELPTMYEGISSRFLACHDPLPLPRGENGADAGLDIECELGAIVDDVPQGISPDAAAARIRLLTIVNDTSLRTIMADRLARGYQASTHGKPPCSMAAVAVTPDELGEAWDGRKLSLPMVSHINGELLGRPNAGLDLSFDLPALVAHAAKFRPLVAGTIIGSGTISNYDRSTGSSCIAERRMIETAAHGAPRTPYLKAGDRVRIEMLDARGRSVFGAIEHRVEPMN